MKQPTPKLKQARSFSARMGSAIGLLLGLSLLLAAPASASYEQVGSFGGDVIGEGSNSITQFYRAKGMAVNVTGAGGVTPGTVYVARSGFESFIEGERQGFFGVPTYSAKGEFLGEFGESLNDPQGVAVDQSTGYVYVLGYSTSTPLGQDVVRVYSADGSQLITSFGARGKSTVDEEPEKIHTTSASGIAVDSSGDVYVADLAQAEARVMVFEPQSPGDFEHYVYAGRSNDIASFKIGDLINYYPANLALDSAGNLYTANEDAIYEFAQGEPAAPICAYQLPGGGGEGMTVNPGSGEVFYFTYKTPTKIHQLSACNPQGEFVQTGTFVLSPKTEEISGLAFNPALAWEASRPPGVLYAADGQLEKSAHADIFAPAEVHPPNVESESVSSVTSSTATLGAQINPEGSQTRYVFQYITDAAYQANEPAERFGGASEAPLGGAVLGSGQSPLSAGVSLVGLDPDTEYHYRVVASSHCDPEKEEELCEDVGADQAFRTFPAEAQGLPDNRAYELVSPEQKNGGEVIPADPATASCGQCKPGIVGDRFPMQSAPDGKAVAYEGFPFSFTEGATVFNEYLSRRTESGWQTTILAPTLMRGGYKAFNAELTQGVFSQNKSSTLSPEAPAGYSNLYVQPTGAPSTLTPLVRAEPPNRNPHFTFAGASADFSQFFFEADDALTGETPFAPEAVDGGAKKNNLYESAGGQLQLVNILPGNAETVPGAVFGSGERLGQGNLKLADFSHAISEGGSRVFWSDESGAVYVRENGESTTAIPDPGKFLTASADGSKVLLDNGHLYDLETEETTDLSEGEGGFQGIAGQSENLSHIYFVDTAVLSGEEENDHGAKAQTGKNNLYAWQGGAAVFIATLLSGDNTFKIEGHGGDWIASPQGRTAEASPAGRWVAFISRAPLTDYDNKIKNGGCFEGDGDPACSEVFLYDSASGKLTCPSCNPSGERPLGFSTLRLIHDAQGSIPQPRYLTNEGRLYFDSQDSLTPFDTNNGVEDVYQYEPEGVGSCKREGGCVSLISAGHEPIDSNFLAADATGENVFFTSRDQLVLKDRDDLIDLYVARENGGIPAETETARIECQGESCQPAAVAPIDPTPGTSSLQGTGNVVERKATKKKAKAHSKKRKHRAKKRRHRRTRGRAANRNRGGAK